jgi:hypothetical protein
MTMLSENKITLSRLAKREGVNVSTVWRWTSRGVRQVRLETFSVGGRRWTTEEAFERFVAATTALTAPQSELSSTTSRGRVASIRAADKRLAAAGF